MKASLVPLVVLAASFSMNLQHLVQTVLACVPLCAVILFMYVLPLYILQLCAQPHLAQCWECHKYSEHAKDRLLLL